MSEPAKPRAPEGARGADAAPAPAGGPAGLVAREVQGTAIAKALAVVGPLVAAFLVAEEPALLNLSLLAMALLIPAMKLGLGPKAVTGHFLVVLAAFGMLFLVFPHKGLFVAATALAAFLAVAVTRHGARLRTLGNWTFIPAVYLACEIREAPSGAALAQAQAFLMSAPLALGLVLLVQALERRGGAPAPALFGPVRSGWIAPACATALAVLAAAALVEALDLDQGQWVIWSAASVVVGDLSETSQKLKLRAMGAVIGAPLGLALGLLLPESRIGYTLAVLAALLTLIAFSRYVVGFGARCFFIALAASLAGIGSGIAEERVENVILGGAFGLLAVILTEWGARRLARRAAA
ncbi:FUSC family protein [Xanthobacter sp. KR7-225]|uniref:FUSC family protein n=1 Tax=Xanthobacter sp. KR7-225 TaxID=3156613 RepID=UPI0032B4967C